MLRPGGAKVVPNSGGLRKLRFAPKRWKTGKRGAARVCYLYFPEYKTVFLVTAYGKGHKEDLSSDELREIRKLVGRLEQYLERGQVDR